MRKDYSEEFVQPNTFWYFALTALNEARLIRLCRVFDQESASLNLYNLLDTIKVNVEFFGQDHFRERLRDNAFVNSLSQDSRIPDKSQLDKDIEFVSLQNPTVRKLIIWRNNIIAHRGAKVSLGKNEIVARNPLSEDEVISLLEGCFQILNRYSSLYNASFYSRQPIGHDDYKTLLNFVRLGLQKLDEDREKELQKLKRKET